MNNSRISLILSSTERNVQRTRSSVLCIFLATFLILCLSEVSLAGNASITAVRGETFSNGFRSYVKNSYSGPIFFPSGSHLGFNQAWEVQFDVFVNGGAGTYYLSIRQEPPFPWNPSFYHVQAPSNKSDYIAMQNFTTHTFPMSCGVPAYSSAPASGMVLVVRKVGLPFDSDQEARYFDLRVDADKPTAAMAVLPPTMKGPGIPLSWSGSDNEASPTSSGIWKYDVQYRVDNGSWTDLFVGTTATSGAFTGAAGHTYYFQCRAYDNVGNVSAYKMGNGDTYTIIPPSDLVVTPSIQAPRSIQSTVSFTVNNKGGGLMSWRAVSNQYWATITMGSGGMDYGSISVSVLRNLSPTSRTALITVTSLGAYHSPQTVSIVQDGACKLSVSPYDRPVSYLAGMTSFSAGNSGGGKMNWTASTISSWISISGGAAGTNSGTIFASYTQNPGTVVRTGVIRVVADGALASPQFLTVTQAGAPPAVLLVAPADRPVSSAAGTTDFSVYNLGVVAMNWTAKSNAAWATVAGGSSGVNAGKVTVSYTLNASTTSGRTASITISAPGATSGLQTVTVTQTAAKSMVQAPSNNESAERDPAINGVEHPTESPTQFVLSGNYPNPFNPSTIIRYGLPHRSGVTLTVFNALGQRVSTLVQETQDAGYHDVKFDGSGLASGVYFYRIQAEGFVQTRKILLTK